MSGEVVCRVVVADTLLYETHAEINLKGVTFPKQYHSEPVPNDKTHVLYIES